MGARETERGGRRPPVPAVGFGSLLRRLYGTDAATGPTPGQVREHWRAELRRRVGYGPRGDYDNTIVVTAIKGKGEGKSALALDLALDLDPTFHAAFETRVWYWPADFLQGVGSLRRREVGILDDAGDALSRQEYWSEAARAITKALAVSRDIHATVILCIPTVRLFNTAVFRSLVDYWFRVKTRGLAQVHPRPPERYDEPHGIGWYPDRDWNPYTWPDPRIWSPARRAVWNRYRELRRAFRQRSFTEKADELRHGSGAARPSAARHSCATCGVTFQRNDQLRRHIGTAKHRENEAAPGGAPAGSPGSSGSRGDSLAVPVPGPDT